MSFRLNSRFIWGEGEILNFFRSKISRPFKSGARNDYSKGIFLHLTSNIQFPISIEIRLILFRRHMSINNFFYFITTDFQSVHRTIAAINFLTFRAHITTGPARAILLIVHRTITTFFIQPALIFPTGDH